MLVYSSNLHPLASQAFLHIHFSTNDHTSNHLSESTLLLPLSTDFHHLPFINMDLINVVFPSSCFDKPLVSQKFPLVKHYIPKKTY